MSELQTSMVLFSKQGPVNTERTLTLAYERAVALGIQDIIIATSTGGTIGLAIDMIPDKQIIAVTHSTGFKVPFHNSIDDAQLEAFRAKGVKVVTTTHVFGGVGRAVRKKLNTYQVDEIIAYTLRTFGQGVKVTAEITLMAADAGMLRSPRPVIAIGGSGRGADTAVVLQPTHAQTMFDLKFLEIICMPAAGHPAFNQL